MDMTPNKAKKLVAASLAKHAVTYDRLTARTVGFEDLARRSAVFVTVHGAAYPEPKLQLVKKDLKGTGALLDPNY